MKAILSRDIARGLSAKLPSNWVQVMSGEYEFPSAWIGLKSDEFNTEIQGFHVSQGTVKKSIDVLKFNAISHFQGLGYQTRPHNSHFPDELIGENPQTGETVYYQFVPTNPILLLTAKGFEEGQIAELRFVASTLEINSSYFDGKSDSEHLSVVTFEHANLGES